MLYLKRERNFYSFKRYNCFIEASFFNLNKVEEADRYYFMPAPSSR